MRGLSLLLALLMIPLAHGQSDFPSEKQSQTYAGESFHNSVNKLYLVALQNPDDGFHRDSFLELKEDPDKRLLASYHWPDRHAIIADWSPDGQYVAVNYETAPADYKNQSIVFDVSSSGLKEVKGLDGLGIHSVLPSHDPAWKLSLCRECVDAEWIDNNHLLVGVAAVFKGKDGYTHITYEVTCVLKDNQLIETSSKQSEYSREN